MTKHPSCLTLSVFTVLAGAACHSSPGRPEADSQVIPPKQILEFNVLFEQNCSGCHGTGGKGGAAIALANPVFLTIADDEVIRHAATGGIPGTSMPAFAESAGGMLTPEQIDSIVRGIRSWAKPGMLAGATPPPYAGETPGDPQQGHEVYATFCSGCHGADGQGTKKASSIVNGSYLALVSNQDLRTIVIVGRPELGAPDWRSDVRGKPMSSQEISDVVAWLGTQRQQFPGQPFANTSIGSATGGNQ